MINVCGHPQRVHQARGMCSPCYQSWRRSNASTTQRATCHPDKPVIGNGLCELCYRQSKPYYKSKAKRNNLVRYGLTPDEFNALLSKQNGVCAICNNPETRLRGTVVKTLSVDHDHETGKVRGLLCTDCNLALGWLADDPTRLRRALVYLEESITR